MDKFCACVCSAGIVLMMLVVVCDLTRQRCRKCDKCRKCRTVDKEKEPEG